MNSFGLLVGLLTVIFVGLKLGGVGEVADWNYWWVLSPLWISVAAFVSIGLIVAAIEEMCDGPHPE